MQPVRRPFAWTAGELLQLVRQQRATSRSRMARYTGLSPSTIASRLEGLLEAGYLVEDGEQSDRGRKPRLLSLNGNHGVVAAVAVGTQHARIGLVDLAGKLRSVTELRAPAAGDAIGYLDWLGSEIEKALVTATAPSVGELILRGIGVSIGSPVDRRTGKLIHPLHLPGWDSIDPTEQLSAAFDVPAIVDNDATLMALGEHRLHHPNARHMLYIKLGSAIGAGIVLDGEVYEGVSGGAGEIGHLPVDAPGYRRLCQCGRENCLEACFGGVAIGAHLAKRGVAALNLPEFLELAASSNPAALEVFQDAGAQIGEAIGTLANIFNPELIVLGGKLAQIEPLTHALHSALYRRSLPLTTRNLVVTVSQSGANAAIFGAAWQVFDVLLSADQVNDELSARALSVS